MSLSTSDRVVSVVAYEWVAVSLDTSAVPVWTVHDATSASRAVCADAFLRFESEGVDKKTNPRFLLISRSGATRAAVNLSLGPTHGPAHASVLVDGAERAQTSVGGHPRRRRKAVRST